MKHIEAIWEVKGRRRKLIGFRAFYNGFEIGEFKYRDEAQAALDTFAYDELAVVGSVVLGRAA